VGQKVSPIGYRLGIVYSWRSKWFSRHGYANFLREDIKIRQYIESKFLTAGVSKVEIERASKNLKVNIYSSRPGIIIGKKGSGAESLKENLTRICKLESVQPTLNIYEVKKSDMDAQLVANGIRMQLEKRVSFRRAMKKAISSAVRAGAKGVKISCSGRLGGADMSRIEKYKEGCVPLHTLRADIDYAKAEALTTYGLIGVKVWVYKGDVLGNL